MTRETAPDPAWCTWYGHPLDIHRPEVYRRLIALCETVTPRTEQ